MFGNIQDLFSIYNESRLNRWMNMIVYKPFWDTIKKMNISQYMLINDYGFSTGTLDSLRQGRSITMNTLNDICKLLDCEVTDVIEYVVDDKDQSE